jgi:hypothetical protein
MAPPTDAVIRLDERSWATNAHRDWSEPSESLIQQVVSLLWASDEPSRFALIYNGVPTLMAAANLQFKDAVLALRRFRGSLCDAVFEQLTFQFPNIVNPEYFQLKPIEAELDGWNINVNNNAPGSYSTKQLHFDVIEPLGSNLYGPNYNLSGGFPVFADLRAYCAANDLDIRDVLQKIPGERVLTVGSDHYADVLDNFSVGFAVDMVNDTPISIVLNRVVEAGVMHGATLCTKIAPNANAIRPILHYEYCDLTKAAADAWYRALNQSNNPAPGSKVDKPLIPTWLHSSDGPLVIDLP